MASEQTVTTIRKMAVALKAMREALEAANPSIPFQHIERVRSATMQMIEAEHAFNEWLLGDRD